MPWSLVSPASPCRRVRPGPSYDIGSTAQIDAAVQLIIATATIVAPTISASGLTTHPEDDVVLAGAITAQVDYLVTGDKQLQRIGAYQGVSILSPRSSSICWNGISATNRERA